MRNEEELEQRWPRQGHAFTYKTHVSYEGYETFDFELSIPSGADQMDLSSVIVGRLGGEADADVLLRQNLYFLIGRIAVASGHIEAAMKRLVLTLQENRSRQFSLVDKTWSDLHKMLLKECKKVDAGTPTADIRRKLKAHLDWADVRRLKIHRDDFIHGSVWDFSMPLLLVSRFHRKADGQPIIFTMEQVEQVAMDLDEYARRLEVLLHGIWHEAMLPETPQVPGYSSFTQSKSGPSI
jgi:hypothetical protein